MQIVLSEQPPSAFPESVAELVWLPRIFITRPERFRGRSVRVVNLSGDCVYLGTGYYASLLAEARGHKVIPSVQTILDLGRRSLYSFALPELNGILGKSLARMAEPLSEPVRLLIAFGNTEDARFRHFTRAVFDRFRHPLLRLVIAPARNGSGGVKSVEALSLPDLAPQERAWFSRALAAHLKVPWRAERAQSVAFRLSQEQVLLDKALVRPGLGWGRWGRSRVRNDEGRDVSVTDSLWIISIGTGGIVGLASLGALLLGPALLLLRRFPGRAWGHPAVAPAGALAVVTVLWVMDCLLNAMISPIFVVAAGGTLTFVASRWRRRKRRAPVEPRERELPAVVSAP